MAAISKDLDSMIQKHKTMLQELSFNMSLTIEVGESLENRNESKRLDELEAVMRAYVEMERRIKIHIHVLEELKSSPNQLKNEQLSLLEPFTKKVNERNNLEERLPFKEHAKYREFRQKIWVRYLLYFFHFFVWNLAFNRVYTIHPKLYQKMEKKS